MARPRVFISSTYYDLKSIRDDIDRFVRGFGFEPVRHERGHVAYGKDEKPEAYAYKEIEFCDLLVCIIGGRFGSHAADSAYSITQAELKTAFERGKQVYIFVDRTVQSEYRYYTANKDVAGVKFTAVDNVKVYQFIDEVYQLPRGNPIFPFDTFSDIASILQEQWAGLFQRLLSEAALREQSSLFEELQRSLQTVGQLVQFLRAEKEKGDAAVNEILFGDHPLFEAVKKTLKNRYRLYFRTLAEFETWLNAARAYEPVPEENWDEPTTREWIREHTPQGKPTQIQILKVRADLFDSDGRLKPMTRDEWKDEWVTQHSTDKDPIKINDDLPF